MTLSVGSIMYHSETRGSSTIFTDHFFGVEAVGVATFGVGLSASLLIVFLRSSAQNWTSCFGMSNPIFGDLVLDSYVSCRMSSREPRTFECYRKIIPRPKVFYETQTQNSFRICNCSSCYLLSETYKFCLGTALL